MKKFFALLIARNKEFYRDKGTLGWTFVFPFVVLLGFTFGYSDKQADLFKIGVHGFRDRADAQGFLTTPHLSFIPVNDVETGVEKVRRHQLDLLLDLPDPKVALSAVPARYWINTTSPKGAVAERLLLGSSETSLRPHKETVTGREVRYVDWLVPGIIAMNMMFSSLFGVGYTIVRYRNNGVLKRLKATPVRAVHFLTAQLVSRLLLIQATSSIVFLGALAIVRFEMRGSFLALFLFTSIGAICMISLGLIFAARIASEELAEGLLNVATWPMMMLSGIWFSLEGAATWIQKASAIFPLTHIVSGSRAIIIDGASLAQVMPQITMLGGLALIFLAVGCAIFRWN